MSYTLMSRTQWKARGVLKIYPSKKIKFITIHYIGAPIPASEDESRRCRSTQNYHMDTRKWSDIAYNYLVGQSGKAYVGRGRNRKNAADGGTKNRHSLSICVLLGTKHIQPTEAMLATVQNLVWDLVEEFPTIKKVRPHKKLKATSCPGPVFTARLKAGEITLRPPIARSRCPTRCGAQLGSPEGVARCRSHLGRHPQAGPADIQAGQLGTSMRYDYRNNAGGIREFNFPMGEAPPTTTLYLGSNNVVVYTRESSPCQGSATTADPRLSTTPHWRRTADTNAGAFKTLGCLMRQYSPLGARS